MENIFISHSWEDSDVSKNLAKQLKGDAVKIWIDFESVHGGDNLPIIIGRAIEWCDTLILLWSKHAEKSHYVGLEWTCALNNKKRIISCILDDTKLPTILTSFLWVDFRDFEQGYQNLLNGLKLESKVEDKPIIEDDTKEPKDEEQQLIFLRNQQLPLSTVDVANLRTTANSEFVNELEERRIENHSVIIDNKTGLIWQQKVSDKALSYIDAEKWAQNLNNEHNVSRSDWRLPTMEEAISLVQSRSKIDTYKLFGVEGRAIWTVDSFSIPFLWPLLDQIVNALIKWSVDFKEDSCKKSLVVFGRHILAVRSVRARIE